ncbi:hypothetical protein [Lysobacter sp. FW306-1B-D06B]|uniref:hypothetical protein n=1 Tax=Lysobacter sp. FW306-1B-D06B TaxID=3140250 RepID=UPI0031400615
MTLHRPCLFGTEVPDPRKPERLRRVHRPEHIQTPLEKLASLPSAERILRPGITLQVLQHKSMELTNVEAARRVHAARGAMMREVDTRRWIGKGWGFAKPAIG